MYPGPFLTWIKRQAASCTICEVRGCKGAQASRAAAQPTTATGAGGSQGGHWGTVGQKVALAPPHFPGWVSPGALLQPKALAKAPQSNPWHHEGHPTASGKYIFSGEKSRETQ